jgi:cell division protein FtsW (lipid II flippase)
MSKLTFTEKFILALVLVMLIIGYILFYSDLSKFVTYVQEDGIVEWLTVLGLILGCIVCVRRFIRLRKYRKAWFLFVTIGLALMLFFAAGEEISWGQRILGLKSPEFFMEDNTQKELNFHNLVVDGVKLNKVIFSIGLIAAMGIYLLIIPILYRYSNRIRTWVDNSGIPLPRLYQIISILLLFVITELLHHEKRAELLEAGIALLFFLIIRYPGNAYMFKKEQSRI